ncbi:MAG TPA: hypothetical protein DDW87_09765, partial [Firmicutes bacterium]|nr:hypothetical protein [Bacillota bacterium]
RAKENTTDYGELLETAKWLATFFTEEIPSRNAAIKSMVDTLARMPSLERELDRLGQTVNEKQDALARLEEEKRAQEIAYQEERQRLVKDRDLLAQEVATLQAELQRRDEATDNVRGVRKVLQGILRSLQGKGDDSSIAD